ncbi:ferritin-like domain-containing protein [Arthrobacter sp. C9C5]|uniref:ferritin-like domain-containing protein n=1 Tax=Arthrobacter sp. C9C5 TaxID=2735267 RepID=UPI0032E0031A
MKDDSREERRRVRVPRHLPRLALLVCLALVVVSLGIAFRPGNPPKPPEPPFSEQARAAALGDALQLRTAGDQLGAAPTGTGRPAAPAAAAGTAVARTVSLLTTQARALLRPGQTPSAAPTRSTTSASATSAAASAAPVDAAGLAADLAKSGRRRLSDAAAADGGMARLLAAVGTAQLLQSSALAAAAGAPDPAASVPAAGPAAPDAAPAGSCPAATASPSAAPASSSPGAAAGNAELPGALAALISTELETVYGYQVALTRLDGAAARSAAGQLARHEALVSGAESLSRSQCAPIPPRQPGYALDPSFLASPGPGLAALEAATLPAYGDLVALSDGETRKWAISGLLGAARRAALWGANPGPVPGLAADPASFPTLPAG